ncbi:PEP-CTERM sorting domain-containing protein [bacterium]|nr:MAG: PEP-CTERM sorting domain-containing protein [bacterium]
MKRLTLLTLLLPGIASAQSFVDYSTQPTNYTLPAAGSTWWHSAVNSNTAGQNANVGRYSNPNLYTATGNLNVSRVITQATLASEAPSALTGNLSSDNAYQFKFGFGEAGTITGASNVSSNAAATTLRVFAAPSANGSAVIDTTKRVQVDVWTANPLRMALLIYEGSAAQDYSTAGVFKTGVGSLEWMGGTGSDALRTTGAPGGFLLSSGWNTLTFDFSAATFRGLTGNGVFNPFTADRAAINGFFFSPDLNASNTYTAQAHNVVMDNWRQVESVPEPGTFVALFAGAGVLLRSRASRKA